MGYMVNVSEVTKLKIVNAILRRDLVNAEARMKQMELEALVIGASRELGLPDGTPYDAERGCFMPKEEADGETCHGNND